MVIVVNAVVQNVSKFLSERGSKQSPTSPEPTGAESNSPEPTSAVPTNYPVQTSAEPTISVPTSPEPTSPVLTSAEPTIPEPRTSLDEPTGPELTMRTMMEQNFHRHMQHASRQLVVVVYRVFRAQGMVQEIRRRVTFL